VRIDAVFPQTTPYTRTADYNLSQHYGKSDDLDYTRVALAAELSHSLFGANSSSSSHYSLTNSNTSVKSLAETIYASKVESEIGPHRLTQTDLFVSSKKESKRKAI